MSCQISIQNIDILEENMPVKLPFKTKAKTKIPPENQKRKGFCPQLSTTAEGAHRMKHI